MKDLKTQQYFDDYTPHFNPNRFNFSLEFIRTRANSESRLIDVGCGDGATLLLMQKSTPIRFLSGMDISGNYLEKAQKATGCEAIPGSILNRELVLEHSCRYDFCLLGSVLHHLVGENRRQSYLNASRCLFNALQVLKPGGHLIVFEPTFNMIFLMDAIFYIKQFFSRFYKGRLEVFTSWLNVGPPVTSFYTDEQLDTMISATGIARVVKKEIQGETRLCMFVKKTSVGLIIQRMQA